MSLKDYQRKRKFSETPEPSAGEPAGRPGPEEPLRFVIHKHDASTIHYDLRLEYEGVLKSWAIPKGLPTPHARKKLAVAVEDHPFEYLTFAGRIPEGQYGAGKVEIWDTGTYVPLDEPGKALEAGKLTVRLEGGKTRGEFTLARIKNRRGKQDDWLAILAKTRELDPDLQAEGTARPMPAAVKPMLAVLGKEPFSSPDFLYEVKFDGIRALSHLSADGSLSIRSRNLNEQAFRYPELADLGEHFLAEELIVDGEIVALDEQGISSFQLLQGRMGLTGEAEIAAAVRSTPVYYYVFDLLYLNGRDLMDLPLIRRKEILARIFMPHRHVRPSDWIDERGVEMFQFASGHGLEGVIGKRKTAPYRQKRSRDWIKVKAVMEQELVIGGYTSPRGSRSRFGALLLGFYDGDDLVYAGHTGTGFSDEMLEKLYRQMTPLVEKQSPFKEAPRTNEPATWLKPELVAQVKFSEWTREGSLRHPVFLGLRSDVDPREIVREDRAATEVSGQAAPRAVPGPPLRDPLQLPAKGDVRIRVDGRELLLTNMDKVIWPQHGSTRAFTKRDMLLYYHQVADFAIAHLTGRPLTLKRYPDGIQAPRFYQKEAPPETPKWMHTERIPSESSPKREFIRYIVCDEPATLLYLANLACISQNPWLSALPELDRPDIIAFDLDPLDPDDFDACVETALLVRDKLAAFGLRGYPKTSGATGMHVYVPIEPRYSFQQARQFAEIISILCRNERPDLISLEQTIARRAGSRLYLDFRQNVRAKTLASVYSLRAQPAAPVSTPLEWHEVKKGIRPSDYTMENVPERLAAKGDLFAGVLTDRQDLMAALSQGGRSLNTV